MDFQEIEQLFGFTIEELLATVASRLGEDATQEEAGQAVAALFDQLAKNMSQTYTLHECLSFMLKEDLIEIAKTLGLHGYSEMQKDALVDYLEEALSDPAFMKTIYPSLSNNEVMILERLHEVNTPLISTDIMYTATDLIQHGLCFLDEYGKHLVMPIELKDAFEKANTDSALVQAQKYHSAIYDVLEACVYLYGVYPISGLVERIQQQTGITVGELELLHWQQASLIQREEFYFKNGYIISTALQKTPEDIISLQQIQKTKKRFFWPTQEQFQEFSEEQWIIDEKWYEPFWDFSPFLMENEFGDIMSVSRFVETSIRTGAPFDSLISFLSEHILAFESVEQLDEFVQIMQNIWNNTPMWENCGYSLNQLKALTLQKSTASQKAPEKSKTAKVISLAEHRAKKEK